MPNVQDEKILKAVNDLNIVFSGKVDNSTKKVEQSININYKDGVTFPIGYKRNGDIYGITSSLILKTYLAVKNENLQEVYNKFGSETAGINMPNKIDTETLNVNPSDIIKALPKIKEIIDGNITDENFSKVDADSYALTLNQTQTVNILKNILNEVKTNKILSNTLENELEKLIVRANLNTVADPEYVKITVKKGGNLTLKIYDVGTFDIQVTNTAITINCNINGNNGTITFIKNGLTYRVEIQTLQEEIDGRIALEVTYSNLTEQTAKEKYILTLERKNKRTNNAICI